MRFRTKWAVAGPVYAGMIFGVVMMTNSVGPVGAIIGVFFGGIIGLPLGVAGLIGSRAALSCYAGAPFPTQFRAFALFTAAGYAVVVYMLDSAFGSLGGITSGDHALWDQFLFYLLGLITTFACMKLWPEG